LRARPGEWARIAIHPTQQKAQSNASMKRRTWGPDYELVGRMNEVYARYIGPVSP
jgi:hypothetical protein